MRKHVPQTVILGEIDGEPYRAHFQGKPTAEDRAFLDEIIRAAREKVRRDAQG